MSNNKQNNINYATAEKYFMTKYKEHYKLFYPLGILDQELDEIANQRIRHIANILFLNSQKQFGNHNKHWNNSNKDIIYKDIIVSSNIKEGLNFKNNTSNFPKQQNFIIYHGTPLKTLQTVPNNCVIIILTPLGRMSYQYEINYDTLIEDIKSYDNYEAFLKNPMCYRRNELQGLYSDSSVYLPGQFYTDIKLSYNYDNDKGSLNESYKGIYTCVFNDDNNPNYTPNSTSNDYVNIYLSNLINDQKLEGLIFVNC